MIKRLTITLLLVFGYVSAYAQIATPLLDRVQKVQSSAATGWRDNSTVGLQAVSATGKVKIDDEEVGDIDIGGSIPGVLAVYRAEALGIELFMATDTTKKADLSVPIAAGVPNMDISYEQKLPETRLNLAYVFGEALSLGFGYRVNEQITEQSVKGTVGVNPLTGMPVIYTSAVKTIDDKSTETGLMVTASLRLAELFYLAGGLENVEAKTSSKLGSDSVTNAWSNTIVGLGMLVGEPGESRFRAEYAIIQSPESKKDAETGKAAHSHYKTDYNTMSLEALFGSVLLSYISETKKVDLDEQKTTTTMMGIGWMPESGLSVSAYSYNLKQTESSDGSETVFEPQGFRLNLGWNF
jgi:hypothetical protein